MKENLTHLVLKIVKYCKSYIELCLLLLVFTIGIRFFEAILLYRNTHDFASSILWNLTGLCYDISLFLRLGIIFLILFIVVCFFSEKKARLFFRVLISLMLLISLILILFFSTSGFLLDNVIFTYSLRQMFNIVKSSSSSPFWVYLFMVAIPALYFYLSGKRMKVNRVALIIFAVLTLSSFFIFNKLSPQTEQYNVKVNKEYFFVKSIFKNQLSAYQANDENIEELIAEFRSYFPEFQFKEIEFPFLHKAEYKDVLSPFLNLQPEPPNFVFIIVEGLEYGYLYNDFQLMPFLDSLSKKSLTWDYCLSVSPRTYGVIPALIGALPLGEKGFFEQCPNNPKHHSLINILQQHKYTQYFFYGGDMNFDNMGCFAIQNNLLYMKDTDWDQDIKEQSINCKWGYEDHLLFLQAHRKLNQTQASPHTDIYLTLSTHLPYEYPKSNFFQNIIKNKIKPKIESEDWLKEYGCYAYTDWALRQLIESYKMRDDYENTIFIITGDHYPWPPQFGGYKNYHVPLIIYSPMLKSGRKMKGVVSHRDITPTLLALLENNYNIKAPTEVAWLNTALDTSLTFNAQTFAPMQLIDHTLGGVLYKNYLFCEDILEELTNDGPRKIDNPCVSQKLNRLLFLYQSIERYILYHDALLRHDIEQKSLKEKVVMNIEDTIANNNSFFIEPGLQVREGPEGHKTTLCFDKSNEYPISLLRFKVPHEIEKFMVEIEFKIYIKNDDENNCLRLVLDLVQDNESLNYHTEYLGVSKHNRWYTVQKMLIYKKEDFAFAKSDCLLKAYLWNYFELEGYIDDIKVKITTSEY